MWTREQFDDALPTVVRWAGFLTTLVLIGFCLAGYYIQAAPGFVAATGMILYKRVHDAHEAAKRNGNGGG